MTPHQLPKILVFDDDEAISDALCMLLELEGFEVQTSEDDDFFEKIASFQPDVVILDIWLSGTDGRELCSQLKQQPETAHIPVILFSASRNLAKSVKASKADAFVEKPFEIETVLKTIQKLIPKKYARHKI